MCGIVGVFNYGGPKSVITEERMAAMTSEIRHRGPDDDGVYISDDRRIGFGFRRLSIIDLSAAGHQPMSTSDGSIWLIFNGEIYNHLDIRKDLEAKGYTYRSRTDTETILYAYQEYGIDFVTKLYGMFAIAIWDSRKNRLFLVRDRIGIKPLYYTFQNGVLYFGSEIKAFLTHPDVRRELNEQGLYDYLSVLMTPPHETLFKGIHKLEAGHHMIVESDGTARQTKYWDVDHHTEEFPAESFESEQFCIDNIRRLLRDSIKIRMMSDVPFGVLLSGGIDSSLNVALMAELMNRPVDTFSVGFKDLEKYNELQYAHQIATQFKTNHHELLLGEQDALDFLPEMIWHQDEPNADPVCVPMYFASKVARDSGTIVVQVGEGSDEQFSGYRHYLKELKYHRYYYSRVPNPVQRMVYRASRSMRPHHLLTDYFRRASQRDAAFYGGALSFSEESKAHLLNGGFRSGLESTGRVAKEYYRRFEKVVPGARGEEFLQKMIYFEFKSRLAELLLMRVDKMSMATSIEARVPFLDHRLVEFTFRIPQRLKIKDGEPKYILKKASEGIIPDNIIYRRKQGFAAPIVEWLRTGRMASYAKERIAASGLTKRDIFDRSYINFLFESHAAGSANNSVQIWTILVASMWYDRFIEGAGD